MPRTESDTSIPDSGARDRGRVRTGLLDELLRSGTVIDGRYRIQSLLGEGGMGAVYTAEHVKVGRRVAFKVLAAQWTSVGNVAQRFRDEARAASAAGHPNIIEVFDAGELPDGRPYLVMELLEGRELAAVAAAQGGLEIARACRIMRDVARALDAAHARGIIHRDLKGENVMLVARGDEEIVKVLDFGIAANSASMGPRATTPGLIIGTPAFMAPEQAKGAKPTIAFDIYALGVLLHDSLTGTVPFEELEGLALLAAKTTEIPPSIATVRDDLPTALVELVDSCLMLDPSLRPATAREIADRLTTILDELPKVEANRKRPTPALGVRPVGPGGTERIPMDGPGRTVRAQPEEQERSRWGMVVLVALLVVSVLGGIGWWIVGRESSRDLAAASERPAPVMPRPSEAGDVPPPIDPTPAPTPTEDVQPVPTPTEPDPPQPADSKADPKKRVPVAVGLPSPPPDDPTSPAARSELCWRTRKQALEARDHQDWPGVLRHTRSTSCWAEQREQRKRLRAKAFMENQDWSACAEASRGFDDAEGRGWYTVCNQRKERG
jgi:serine/threonine protein kinase